jgi:hypothetical protein
MAATASGRTTTLAGRLTTFTILARSLAVLALETEETTDGSVGVASNGLSNAIHPTEARTDNVTSGIGDGPNGTIGSTD